MDWPASWITAVNILLLYLTWNWVEGALSGYNDTPTQYHIQTDEGPERYFRFQTYNGQYRKEKRLDDGTVVGSYGWVDPAGFLRMTDYIADGAGYRVTKSRMEYVGVKAVPEEEHKKYTPMKHSTKVVAKRPIFLNALESVIVPLISNDTRKPKLSSIVLNETPTTFSPILQETVKPLPKLFNGLTSRPIRRLFGTPTPTTTPAASTTQIQSHKQTLVESSSPTPTPKVNIYTRSSVNVLENNPRSNIPSRGFVVYARKSSSPNIFRAAESRPKSISIVPAGRFGRTQPSIRAPVVLVNGQSAEDSNNNNRDVFRNYTTPLRRGTGFVYKIPNQYHKDETEADGSRTGSFGYVDPFGIRRVIHYNAGRNGFKHSKDFKYVGKPE